MRQTLFNWFLLFALFASPLLAQYGNYQDEIAKRRLLAKRAAMVDAYRNIAEQIKGLRISSNTTVKDFISESDQIRTAFSTFIRGIRVSRNPDGSESVRYYPDGTCEVDVEITLVQVIEELKTITKRYYYGNHYTDRTFDTIRTYERRQLIRATGSGVPRENITPYEEPPLNTGIGNGNRPNTNDRYPNNKYPEPRRVYQAPWAGQVHPRGRLLAKRAAVVDAYRNMAETIKGLRISSTTTVSDFVAENDQINTELSAFINGMRPVGEARYNNDFTVEVDVEVTLVQVIARLKQTARRYYSDGSWQEDTFNKISEYEKRNVIRVTGAGAVAEKYILKRNTFDPPVRPPINEESVRREPVTPDWASRTIIVTGMGVPPDRIDDPAQARVMAERAAKVDAYRNATEQIMGIQISADTYVRDFIAEHDEIRTEVEEFIIGGRVVDTRYLSDGTTEVDVEISLMSLWNIMKRY